MPTPPLVSHNNYCLKLVQTAQQFITTLPTWSVTPRSLQCFEKFRVTTKTSRTSPPQPQRYLSASPDLLGAPHRHRRLTKSLRSRRWAPHPLGAWLASCGRAPTPRSAQRGERERPGRLAIGSVGKRRCTESWHLPAPERRRVSLYRRFDGRNRPISIDQTESYYQHRVL